MLVSVVCGMYGSYPATDSPMMLTTYCVITPFLSVGGGCHFSVEFTGVAERDATNPGTVHLRMKENWNNTHEYISPNSTWTRRCHTTVHNSLTTFLSSKTELFAAGSRTDCHSCNAVLVSVVRMQETQQQCVSPGDEVPLLSGFHF